MLGVKSRNVGTLGVAKGGYSTTGGNATCEVRPCGMLVQKRNSDVNQTQNIVHNIKVRVKYGSVYHEVNIKPHATFGNFISKLLFIYVCNMFGLNVRHNGKHLEINNQGVCKNSENTRMTFLI